MCRTRPDLYRALTVTTLLFVALSFARAETVKPVDSNDLATDPDLALAFQMQRAFQKLAQKVSPTVVSLKVSARAKSWKDDLQRMTEQFGPGTQERLFEGSGVIVDADGSIITNEHVVRGADTIRVLFSDSSSGMAEVVGLDPRSDLAMLKLKPDESLTRKLTPAQLGDSDLVMPGHYAMAVGNPFGLSNSITMGIISARNRNMPLHGNLSDVFYGNLIQTDTPINPGNSGGPLFDLSGKLIGINTMIFSNSGTSQACGFAIPVNHLKPRIAYLKIGREIEYGWLGVGLDDLARLQGSFKVPDNKGVIVQRVYPNCPADRGGLTNGMVILNFDGTRVSNVEELIAIVSGTPIGKNVILKAVNRAGNVADYTLRVSKRPNEEALTRLMNPNLDTEAQAFELEDLAADNPVHNVATPSIPAVPGAPVPLSWRGIIVKELSVADGAKKGGRIEIVRVKKSSPADRAGLYEGAIISELKYAGNKAIQKLQTLQDLKRLIGTVSGPVALYTPLDGYVTVEEK